MPHPIPEEKVLERALKFISCRQTKQRPTTEREMSKTIGLGVDRLLGLFEREHIEYALVPHGKKFTHGTVEILLINLPERVAEDCQIDNEALHSAYQRKFGNAKPKEPVEYFEVYPDTPGDEISDEEQADPYAPYRISREYFQVIEENLISFAELRQKAEEKGYSYKAIYLATGGPMMRYVLPSDHWRPFILGNKRYFHKDVLKHLPESDSMSEAPVTGQRRKRRRQIRQGKIQNPTIFASRYEMWAAAAQREEDLKDYLIR